MTLLALGLNHRTSPIELREQMTVDREKLEDSLDSLSKFVKQGVILSTCNRLEIYAYDDVNKTAKSRLVDFIQDYSGIPQSRLTPHLYDLDEESCVKHLFRVTSGLDSMIIGERQILGQVRTAFSTATQGGYVRGPLSKLFHQALRVSRYIHRHTNLGKQSRSVSRSAVHLAQRVVGDLTQKRVLVVGAGDTGRLVARALCDAGAREIVVVNRTEWRADDLAKELGGISAPFDRLESELLLADVVISSTGSPGFIIEESDVSKVASARHDRPLLFIDIAVPRDIDPKIQHLEGVSLYDIDSLQDLSETSSTSLQQDITWAEHIVEQETASFQEWRQSLDLVPLITSIRDKAELMRNEEIDRTIKKLESLDLPDQEILNEQLQLMTKSLVNKILHDPTIFLKESRDPSRQQIARDFFNLDGRNRRRGTK